MATFTGTPGNDTFDGTTSDDIFDLASGGNDTANGLDGNDVFNFGATLTAADHVDGGTGNDTVNLAGDYCGLVFGADFMTNVETLKLGAGFDYISRSTIRASVLCD